MGDTVTESTVQPSFSDKIIQLTDWWDKAQASSDPSKNLRLLDIRSFEQYSARRLDCEDPNLNVVPFPIEVMKDRSFELPARHIEFSILVSPSDIDDAEKFLMGRKANARKRPPNPWRVQNVLVDSPLLWDEAKKLNILQDKSLPDDDSKSFPFPRLWQPDRMVEEVLLPLLKNLSPSENELEVWDLGSGAGRDVAFLSEQLTAVQTPHNIVAFDHRYNSKETRIVTDFFSRRGVQNHTKCRQLNCSTWETVKKQIEVEGVKVKALYAVRFWKPDLVSNLATCTSVMKGTIFALSHFCKPYEGAAWNFEHPSEKTVLERHELMNMFKDHWTILHDKIVSDTDHGRTMINFVARRD